MCESLLLAWSNIFGYTDAPPPHGLFETQHESGGGLAMIRLNSSRGRCFCVCGCLAKLLSNMFEDPQNDSTRQVAVSQDLAPRPGFGMTRPFKKQLVFTAEPGCNPAGVVPNSCSWWLMKCLQAIQNLPKLCCWYWSL